MWRPDRRILVSVADTDALAQFLRARRELVHPADVGLPEDGHRRVVGLRREEVAMLAGISAEYYLRLERHLMFRCLLRVDDDVEHERASRADDLQGALQRRAQLAELLHSFAGGLLSLVQTCRRPTEKEGSS